MTNRAPGQRELVGFRVGDQAFCIDITSVLEIRGWTPATPVPQSPHYMKGVVNLRGSVLPIIDLAARLGLPTTEPSARHAIMVANCGGRTVGLLVEGVSDIVELDDADRQATPDMGHGQGGVVAGIFAVDGAMLSLLTLGGLSLLTSSLRVVRWQYGYEDLILLLVTLLLLMRQLGRIFHLRSISILGGAVTYRRKGMIIMCIPGGIMCISGGRIFENGLSSCSFGLGWVSLQASLNNRVEMVRWKCCIIWGVLRIIILRRRQTVLTSCRGVCQLLR